MSLTPNVAAFGGKFCRFCRIYTVALSMRLSTRALTNTVGGEYEYIHEYEY